MNELMPLFLLLGAVVGLWLSAMRSRERAVAAARTACERNGVALLDQTVALTRLRLARNDYGRRVLRRTYGFELTTDGYDRHGGWLEMVGIHVTAVHLEMAGYHLIEGRRDGEGP